MPTVDNRVEGMNDIAQSGQYQTLWHVMSRAIVLLSHATWKSESPLERKVADSPVNLHSTTPFSSLLPTTSHYKYSYPPISILIHDKVVELTRQPHISQDAAQTWSRLSLGRMIPIASRVFIGAIVVSGFRAGVFPPNVGLERLGLTTDSSPSLKPPVMWCLWAVVSLLI